ncbi:DUF1360 domain-containing protein [Spiroplasma endosymbiont of Nomada ruficornis]|uniref:DUF1360 domain-containing protein n=1 Tax=Spiroplasma endosymbiont of Nomada ruficornis TaxID=3066325 RepID=UPI00313E95C4
MALPIKTILAEQFKTAESEFTNKFKKNNENWHNGETFMFENQSGEDNELKYLQFETSIVEGGKEYSVYDEIIEINNKPVLLLEIHDDEKKEIWQQLIYLEADQVIKQIRHLSYEQFSNEVKNDESFIKLEENKDTTIIRIPFFDFINNLNEKQKEEQVDIKNKKVRKVLWQVLKITIFVVAWAGIGILSSLVVTPLVAPVVATFYAPSICALISGVIVGGVVTWWEKYKEKIKKLFLPNWKSKSEINLENKLQEQRLLLKREQQEELFLSLPPEAKQQRILNSFQQIWNNNKNKNFMDMQNELSQRFEENKRELKQQNLENIDKRKDELQEQVEAAKKDLSAEQNGAIQNKLEMITFVASVIEKENQKPQSDEHDLIIFEKEVVAFTNEIEEILKNNKKSDNLVKEDVREKSPSRKMRQISL